MAWRDRLTQSRRFLPATIVAAGVLLSHLVVLQWLRDQIGGPAALKSLGEPMVTRVLMPEEPVAASIEPRAPESEPVAPAGSDGLQARQVVAAVSRPSPPPVSPASAAAIPPASASPPGAGSPPPPGAASSAPAAPDSPVASPLSNLPVAAMPVTAAAASPAAPSPGAATPATPAPLAASSAPPRAGGLDWPPDTLVRYQLEGEWRSGPLHGSAQVQWQRQDSRYQTRIAIDLGLFGSLILTSQGELAGAHLVPRAYEEQRRNRRRLVRMPDEAVVLADGRQVERPAQVQDTASQFIELGQRLARSVPAPRVGQTLQMPLARPGGVDLWSYDIVAEEMVNLPKAGEVSAFRLRPRRPGPAADNGVTAEIWFAPRLQYLPVRILLTLGTEARIDLKVESIEQR